MSLNKLFDKVFVINLDRREDRLMHVTEQMKSQNISFERVSAIDGATLTDIPEELKGGAYGCTLSHRKCIEMAKNSGAENVLIFEDDVVLDENFTDIVLSSYHKVPRDWKFLYFGGNHIRGLDHVMDNVFKLRYSYATHAYAIHSSMYDMLLNVMPLLKIPVDVFYASLHSRYDSYLIRGVEKQLSWQLASFSDIENHHVTYSSLML